MFDAKELLNVLTGSQPAAGSPAGDPGAAFDRGKTAAADAANQAA